MIRVFHLHDSQTDESARLMLETLLASGQTMDLYGPVRLPFVKNTRLPAFTETGWLPIQSRLYVRKHVQSILETFTESDRIVLTDWISCQVLPSAALRKHRALQLVMSLPAGMPASWQHGFVKASRYLRVVVPNELIADTLKRWGVTSKNIHLVPPPFATQIPPQPAMKKAGEFMAGTVSRLAQNQGLETLIQSIQSCTDVIPPMKLFIIGDGPDKRRIQWLIDQTHLKARVQVGANDYDYRRFLVNLNLYIAAHDHDTGFNAGIAHAMARGLPVIATDLPGHRSMIEHGKTGLLYAPGNSHMLAQHLINLYTHPDWMQHYAKIGPDLVRSRYRGEEFLRLMGELLQ